MLSDNTKTFQAFGKWPKDFHQNAYINTVLAKLQINSGFELTVRETRFAIHFDYFAEHFFLFFLKFANHSFLAKRSFNFKDKYFASEKRSYIGFGKK